MELAIASLTELGPNVKLFYAVYIVHSASLAQKVSAFFVKLVIISPVFRERSVERATTSILVAQAARANLVAPFVQTQRSLQCVEAAIEALVG